MNYTPLLCPKNVWKMQKVMLFIIWRREEIGARGLTLTYLNSWVTDPPPTIFLPPSILAISRGNEESKLDQKGLGPSCSYKNLNLWKIIEALLLTAKTLSLVKMSAKLDRIWGKKDQKTIKKGYDCFWHNANFWRFLKWELHMLPSRNLTGLYNFMRPSTRLKTQGINQRVPQGVV